LGSGLLYGQKDIITNKLLFPPSPMEVISIALNGTALAAIEKAALAGDKYFSIGGTLNPNIIPEPGTLTLAMIGMLAMGGLRRWRARRPGSAGPCS
jgi:hypothetical protein